MGKLGLYFNTIKYLKPVQIFYQFAKRLGVKAPLINNYEPKYEISKIRRIPAIKELDFDPVFLERFPVEDFVENKVTFLHDDDVLDLRGTWFFKNHTPLWNHNLHYFEYLFSLINAYKKSNDKNYYMKVKEYISSWIDNNKIGVKNSAWECYPIALRIPIWIDVFDLLFEEINDDEDFKQKFLNSLFEQYLYLFLHLEKHLLANHYFEDLRTLVVASIFFDDKCVYEKALNALLKQCDEQILADGFHYERSPMYQKILLEDLIRTEFAIESYSDPVEKLREILKNMLDVSYSLENNLERMPLFNDCGTNISKSLNALVSACSMHLKISPETKLAFPNAGYYIFNKNDYRIVIDAGQPGPDYSPGHAHCEMMSFELFHKGVPLIVNCGTYAYQCNQRHYFKSTEAHNTFRVVENEQSEIWSNFRMARRARVQSVDVMESQIKMQISDYKANILERSIKILDDKIVIKDISRGHDIVSFLHFTDNAICKKIDVIKGSYAQNKASYSEEFGIKKQIAAFVISGNSEIEYIISLKEV